MHKSVICNLLAESHLPQAEVVYGTATRRWFVAFDRETESTEPSVRLWLVASVTKLFVAAAMVKLAAEGRISLTDRIRDVLPQFQAAKFRKITFRHLLTHSSGLPDTVPNNTQLRAAHASLQDFVNAVQDTERTFEPSSRCSYSSIGFMLLGAAVEEITSCPLPNFLQEQFLTPLGMSNSWLGLPPDDIDLQPRVVTCQLPVWQQPTDDWNWNSDYWRQLGAPWGGFISTGEDLAQFAQMILRGAANQQNSEVLPTTAIRESLRNQTQHIATGERNWGFGWRRQWPDHHASFGDFVGPNTVGHWGATGTLVWVDPDNDQFAVILTSTPFEISRSTITRISNVIATSDLHSDNPPG